MLRVIELPLEIKQHLLVWQSDPYFKKMDKSIQNYVKNFIDILQIAEDNPTIEKEKNASLEIKGAQKFIGLFQKAYLELIGRETTEKFNGVTIKIFSTQVKKLIEAGATVEDYVNWLFKEFFLEPANQRCLPPNVNFCMSCNMIEKFLFVKKDELLMRKKSNDESEKRVEFIKVVKKLYDIFKDRTIAQVILNLARNEITIKKAYGIVYDFCVQNNDLETINEIDSILYPKKQKK